MNNNYGWDINPNDSENYINMCKKIIENSEIFDNFKSFKEYNVVLEHVDQQLGLQYYEHIQKFGKEVYDNYLNQFLENDKIGNPTQFFYGNEKISPTTLRYIKNSLDLSYLCSDEDVSKIVEVGGGYGGLCKTLSVVCEFDHYINIDLPETLELQKKYLSNFDQVYSKCEFVSCEKINEIHDIDLFISNYSLSELTISCQLEYIDKVIKNSKIVYITYNSITGSSENYDIFKSKLKEVGFKFYENYFDYGYHDNKIITCKK
jgi:putative sugar O-methyltransferase